MTKVYRQVFFMELRNLLTYRADFWINFFGQTFFSLVVAYYLWLSVFEYTGSQSMQGYTLQGIIFYYLMAPLISRIQQGQGIGFAAREIYDGQLNKYLLYPLNYFGYKFAAYFAYSSFYIGQLFLILFLYNLFFYDPSVYQFSLAGIFLFLIAMTLACILFFFLFSLTEFLAFWFDNTWSLGVILRFGTSFFGGGLIPLKFFPDWALEILEFTPFPYLIDFPLKALNLDLTILEFSKSFSISLVWTLFFVFTSLKLWKKGQYKYTGVGI